MRSQVSRHSRDLLMKCSPIVIAVVCASTAACNREQPKDATPAASTPAPMTVSVAQFQQMRWLEGSWRGSGGGIDAFFEGYRFVDDSTIRSFEYPDSTLVAKDSGEITLRG